jgi:Flp pilus assembly protein TadG
MLNVAAMKHSIAQKISKIGHLSKCQSGIALTEFAFCLPIFTGLGLVGTEVANLAMVNMKVSQVAMAVADNLSRAKQSVPLGLPQLREHDINDAFIGANLQGEDLAVLRNGRLVVSSLQQNAAGGQWIAWQRCKGQRVINSSYGAEGTGATGTGFAGMGTGSRRVTASPGTAIIFVEFTYSYQPIVAGTIFGPITIREETAFFVRDDRDLTQVYNPEPVAAQSLCNVYTST